MNKVILFGNLTKDIELRYLEDGTAIASSSIAVNKKYKSRNGDKKEDVLFIDIGVFGKTGEILNQYAKKGSRLLVEGELKLENWIDSKTNQKKSKHKVIVNKIKIVDYAKKSDSDNEISPEVDISNDEIPF